LASIAPLLLTICVLFPLQYTLARWTSIVSRNVTDLITKRVHLMSEVLTTIKLIKFYTWENLYRMRVNKMRQVEILGMRKELGLKIASFTVVFTAPVLSMCVALAVFASLGNKLTPDILFTNLYLFNTLRLPLMLLPNAERVIDGANSSFERLQDFLLLPEVDKVDPESDHIVHPTCAKFVSFSNYRKMQVSSGTAIWTTPMFLI
jgi:hypothetical protein